MVGFHYLTMLIRENAKPVVSQTPHCTGEGVNRRLFNKSLPTANSSFILAKRDGQSEKAPIILQAGAAQGIAVGSQIAVHAYNFPGSSGTPNPRLGRLTVNSVDAFSSVLRLPSDTPRPINFRFRHSFTASLNTEPCSRSLCIAQIGFGWRAYFLRRSMSNFQLLLSTMYNPVTSSWL